MGGYISYLLNYELKRDTFKFVNVSYKLINNKLWNSVLNKEYSNIY